MKKTELFVIPIVIVLFGTVVGVLGAGPTIYVVPDFSIVTANPYPLIPYAGNPVLNASMVTDRQAVGLVGDPFLFYDNNLWYMFFEVLTNSPLRNEIGLATSNDGFHWSYKQIVLSDVQFQFSFPQVYKVNGTYYMVPDSYGLGTERLYEAQDFPYNWTFVSTLISGRAENSFADPSLFYYDNLWWMFVSDTTNSNLYLYYSQDIESGWTKHPLNPIISNDLGQSQTSWKDHSLQQWHSFAFRTKLYRYIWRECKSLRG